MTAMTYFISKWIQICPELIPNRLFVNTWITLNDAEIIQFVKFLDHCDRKLCDKCIAGVYRMHKPYLSKKQ